MEQSIYNCEYKVRSIVGDIVTMEIYRDGKLVGLHMLRIVRANPDGKVGEVIEIQRNREMLKEKGW